MDFVLLIWVNELPYVNFNWKNSTRKVLVAMGYEEKSKWIDEVDLVADSTFHSKIARTGIFKGRATGYEGKKQDTLGCEKQW